MYKNPVLEIIDTIVYLYLYIICIIGKNRIYRLTDLFEWPKEK